MSYAISYRRQVFRMPAVQAGGHDDVLFFVEEVGDNNCYELDSRRRARHWQCTAAGCDYACLAEITRKAANCCGGSLVLGGRRGVEPETYIRAWRRALATAVPFTAAPAVGFRLSLFVGLTFKDIAADVSVYRALCERIGDRPLMRSAKAIQTDVRTWAFDSGKPEEVALWLSVRPPGPGWRSVEVEGPRR